MKVTNASGPQPQQTFQTGRSEYTKNAIKAFEATQAASAGQAAATPQQEVSRHADTSIPVANPNAISAEELSAIVPRTQQMDTSTTNEVAEVPVISEEKPKEDPLQSQYQILARREKALRAKVQQQEQAIKAKEAELSQKSAALDARIAELQADIQSKYIPRDRLKLDSLGVLAEEGIGYDELTQQMLNPVQRDPRMESLVSRLEAKIASMQETIDKSSKAQVEAQDSSYKAALNQIKTDVSSMIKSNPEFEAIERTGSVQDVVDLIEATYKQTGVVMSNEEAAAEVEQYLVDEAFKLSNMNKIKRRLAANSANSQTKAPAQNPAGNSQKQPQPMKTLTNATASSRTLSAKERAILAFKGELK